MRVLHRSERRRRARAGGRAGEYETSALFAERERAALAYVEAATDPTMRVDDACFARLRAQFDEQAIIELTALLAFQNLSSKFNVALAVPAQGVCAMGGRKARRLAAAAQREFPVCRE
jgi:alkylhydroperoxidase family enzyme